MLHLSLQTRLAKTVHSQNRRRGCHLRESASLVTGKTDKIDTDHEASSARTDLARWQKKDPEIKLIVRLQTEYEREAVIIHTSWVGVKWLWNQWYELEVGYVRNGLLYGWFISNSRNEEHLGTLLLVSRMCVEIVLYNTHIPAWRMMEKDRNAKFCISVFLHAVRSTSISLMRCRLVIMLSLALLVMLYS